MHSSSRIVVRDGLRALFPGHVVGLGHTTEWPPRSPDLTPMDFVLWRYLKGYLSSLITEVLICHHSCQHNPKKCETVYKIVCAQCPSYLGNLVHVRNDSINLRSKNNLTFPRFKPVTYGKECLRYKAPFYWNSLPNDMKNASSLYSFKSFVSKWAPACSCGFCLLCKVIQV